MLLPDASTEGVAVLLGGVDKSGKHLNDVVALDIGAIKYTIKC